MFRQQILQNKNQVNSSQQHQQGFPLKFVLPLSPQLIVRQNKPLEMPSNAQDTNGNKKLISVNTRLLVSNLPPDMTEVEFVEIFSKFGKMKEFFMNHFMQCAFVVMDTCENAEITRMRLDRQIVRGQLIHVRYPTAGGIAKKLPNNTSKISVHHLHPMVSNELLEQAFEKFGKVKRAVVIADSKGQSTTRGIVEFNNELSAQNAVQQIQKGCYMVTNSLRPVYAEIIKEDSEVGLPEHRLAKSTEYYSERQTKPRFAVVGSFDDLCANTWKGRYKLERMQRAVVDEKLKKSREMFEEEMRSCQLQNLTTSPPSPTSYNNVEVPEEVSSMNLEEASQTNVLNSQHRQLAGNRMEINYTITDATQQHISLGGKLIPVQIANQVVTGQIRNNDEETFQHPANQSAARTRSRKSWTGKPVHSCPQCNKPYLYRTSLISHMRTNNHMLEFKCEHCSKLFTKKKDFDRHLLGHTKPHTCQVCSRSYSSIERLNKHKLFHPSEVKGHICHHCGESFNQAGILRRHMRIHTGENLAKSS